MEKFDDNPNFLYNIVLADEAAFFLNCAFKHTQFYYILE